MPRHALSSIVVTYLVNLIRVRGLLSFEGLFWNNNEKERKTDSFCNCIGTPQWY